jgi:hypothetical protein
MPAERRKLKNSPCRQTKDQIVDAARLCGRNHLVGVRICLKPGDVTSHGAGEELNVLRR